MKYLLDEHRGEFGLVLLLATGLAMLIGAASLPAPMFDPLGPAGLPRYIAWLLLALLVVRIFVLLREASRATPETGPKAKAAQSLLGAGERGIQRAEDVDAPQIARFGLVVVITLIYLVALTVGGLPFTWITLLFLAALGAAMTDFTARKLVTVAAIAVVMSFVLTYTFTDILSVVLPQ
ncbi:tripartite tricarboxylate transporter TctB family protein [Phaeobacter sp. J2-8]|uniref:tripartite tricarboxylate transporter TctB family protein n=1 Tax=Phaeobacter sp. J2-8 TaxID=2931394 RepID=UPI001FD30056|nr:tripartite tricarboxylate transporter TctB family protein [Phaeobacter sp. J2-8]MCJ7872113.1 tripartite tricarboxylate transporter TctB family protein [Phaeobacter sp. J2-8]